MRKGELDSPGLFHHRAEELKRWAVVHEGTNSTVFVRSDHAAVARRPHRC